LVIKVRFLENRIISFFFFGIASLYVTMLQLATTGSLYILPNYTNECQIRKQYALFKGKILTLARDVVRTTPILHSGRGLNAQIFNSLK
jgi:hypothetical protein